MSHISDIRLRALEGIQENCSWPAELASGINIYAYAGGDPINGTDPSGLASPANDDNAGLGGALSIDNGCGAAVRLAVPPQPPPLPATVFLTASGISSEIFLAAAAIAKLEDPLGWGLGDILAVQAL